MEQSGSITRKAKITHFTCQTLSNPDLVETFEQKFSQPLKKCVIITIFLAYKENLQISMFVFVYIDINCNF